MERMERKGVNSNMMNFNSKRNKVIASVIVIVLVLAMVVSTLLSAFM